MIFTTLLLSNHTQCNFCRKHARYKIAYATTENSDINVKYCNTHFIELKKAFIDQLLIGNEEIEEEAEEPVLY